ncbi:hypothetical protein R6Q59_029660 [Mikania micrantha]
MQLLPLFFSSNTTSKMEVFCLLIDQLLFVIFLALQTPNVTSLFLGVRVLGLDLLPILFFLLNSSLIRGGFGAWCWYKIIAVLEECKFRVTAIDLTGSGIDLFDTNSIKSLSQYVTPLTDFLEKLADGEKVILVGHEFGGAGISYAMELFPSKLAKAIFIAASMLKSGQSNFDMFSQKNEKLNENIKEIPKEKEEEKERLNGIIAELEAEKEKHKE